MKRRILRINELLKTQLAKIFLKEMQFGEGVLVTLTRVETTSDLTETKIFVSVFPEEKRKKILDFLNKRVSFFQKTINKKLVMKRVPKISFVLETKVREAAKVEEILEELKKEKK